jgi:mitochondrial chaperone BCS1
MHWLSKQPAFGKSREFEITTRSVGKNTVDRTAGDIEDEEEEGEQFSHGQCRIKFSFNGLSDKRR